ncbi:hypothetical protein BsWGS_04062 [Bradybaena similaris]
MSRYYDDSIVVTCQTDMKSPQSRAYIIFISVALLGLPLLALTVLYLAIIRTLRCSTTTELTSSNIGNSVRNERAMASRRQVVRMMIGVMCLYFVCLVPLRCVQIWYVFLKETDLINLGFEAFINLMNCVRILVFVNSAGNPIIYGLLSSNFRAAFRQLFTGSHCTRGAANANTSNYYNQTSYPHQRESTVLETTHLDRAASIRPALVKKDESESELNKCTSRPVPSNLRNRSNSTGSGNSVDREMPPLLGQARKDADCTTMGYQQMKPGLAYV